jgi:hypothetical protein
MTILKKSHPALVPTFGSLRLLQHPLANFEKSWAGPDSRLAPQAVMAPVTDPTCGVLKSRVTTMIAIAFCRTLSYGFVGLKVAGREEGPTNRRGRGQDKAAARFRNFVPQVFVCTLF